ncbi:MAG: tetratricopeptide repeat protein, partial [Cytophagales bacterium]
QEYLDRAITGGNREQGVLFKRGKSLAEQKEYQLAVRDFDEALKAGENTVALFKERANAYLALGNRKAATDNLTKALALDPNNSDLYYNVALIKEEGQEYEAAKQDYDKAIRLNPKDAAAFYGRANCKAELGDPGAGIADLDDAIEIDGKNSSYYKLRGNFNYELGNKDAACADWKKAFELGDAKAKFSVDQYCGKK